MSKKEKFKSLMKEVIKESVEEYFEESGLNDTIKSLKETRTNGEVYNEYKNPVDDSDVYSHVNGNVYNNIEEESEGSFLRDIIKETQESMKNKGSEETSFGEVSYEGGSPVETEFKSGVEVGGEDIVSRAGKIFEQMNK